MQLYVQNDREDFYNNSTQINVDQHISSFHTKIKLLPLLWPYIVYTACIA